MEYKITATLGPASDRPEIWEAMLAAGATGFRLNTSHLSLEQLAEWLDRLEPYLASRQERVYVVLDLQGSKWRLGRFEPWDLEEGQVVHLVHAQTTGAVKTLPVPHADFFEAASLSSPEIVLNDAKVRLVREGIQDGALTARVVQAGPLLPHKGITFAASQYRKERLGEKDQTILEQTHHLKFVHYAISYIKDAAEMQRYRQLAGQEAYLVAKIERQPALEEAARIALLAQEIWLCRGDLGAESGLALMAEQVHRFSEGVKDFSTPILLAGQVLEHMTGSSNPTRSEVSCLYETLMKGYQGFVLSDETAVGNYPLEACQAAALFRRESKSTP